MPAVERMTITMPAELAETLRQTVAGGEYASTSEVVREALRE
ncbi:Ribbon-helix-helix protein, copG family, partial [Paracoccus chinensis]